jgi:hypothetical protein
LKKMKKARRGYIPLLILLMIGGTPASLNAAEYTEGRIKLVLHEDSGRFSLYAFSDRERYEPLFVDQDPRTSFLTLLVDERAYKMGDASSFRVRIGEGGRPSLIFESSFLLVTQEFDFIKTAGSSEINGVKITIGIENRSSQQAEIGARLVLDTSLGESVSGPHFVTDSRGIAAETMVDKRNSDHWWISRNDRLSLMGSIKDENSDSLLFANWKRISEVPWKMGYLAGRNFSLPPYSVDDSAVCYYFDPLPLARGAIRTCSFMLALGDEGGFSSSPSNSKPVFFRILDETDTLVETADPSGMNRDQALALLETLIRQIDSRIQSGVITDTEINVIELIIERLKTQYGF